MSTPEPLFDATAHGIVPVPVAPPARSLKERQAAKIAAGEHPLSGVGEVPKRIPLAPAGTGTCGTCAHKARPHHHRRAYPKCDVGAKRVPYGEGFLEVWPRAAHSEATDLRSGWPACTSYEPREARPRSTLHGWAPRVGDLVWAQWYSPTKPALDSPIEDRIASGATYGERCLRLVTWIGPGGSRPDLTRWYVRDPDRDLGQAFWEGGRSDWCVLEDASGEVNDRG